MQTTFILIYWLGNLQALLAQTAQALPFLILMTLLAGRRGNAALCLWGGRQLLRLGLLCAAVALPLFPLMLLPEALRRPQMPPLADLLVQPAVVALLAWLPATLLLWALLRASRHWPDTADPGITAYRTGDLRLTLWGCLLALLLFLLGSLLSTGLLLDPPQGMQRSDFILLQIRQGLHLLFRYLSLAGGALAAAPPAAADGRQDVQPGRPLVRRLGRGGLPALHHRPLEHPAGRPAAQPAQRHPLRHPAPDARPGPLGAGGPGHHRLERLPVPAPEGPQPRAATPALGLPHHPHGRTVRPAATDAALTPLAPGPAAGYAGGDPSSHSKGSAMRHILLALVFLLAAAVSAPAAEKTFSQFAVDLPDGWTSDERPGFQSGHPDEYMLLLGKRGEEAVEAHISIFILPNKDGMDARTFASRMREMQDAPTELQQEGTMWTFRGTPRSRALAMETLTRVSADDARILIIMEQDPAGLGTARVVDSLRGLTPASKALLGR